MKTLQLFLVVFLASKSELAFSQIWISPTPPPEPGIFEDPFVIAPDSGSVTEVSISSTPMSTIPGFVCLDASAGYSAQVSSGNPKRTFTYTLKINRWTAFDPPSGNGDGGGILASVGGSSSGDELTLRGSTTGSFDLSEGQTAIVHTTASGTGTVGAYYEAVAEISSPPGIYHEKQVGFEATTQPNSNTH